MSHEAPPSRPAARLSGHPAGGRTGRSWSPAAVLAIAGLLFVTSAHDARDGFRADPTDSSALYTSELSRQVAAAERVGDLSRRIEDLTASEGKANSSVAGLRARAAELATAAGMSAVAGPTLTVTLDDAPPGRVRAGFRPDELVVHQQDLQAVVNALWAGGAGAMTIMGRRVIATTAVRCVGNTLLLGDTLYSPPYVVVALGEPGTLRRALDASPEVGLYRAYVDQVGLGFQVRDSGVQTLPAHAGAPRLDHAVPLD